jgi:invasion protein IalB
MAKTGQLVAAVRVRFPAQDAKKPLLVVQVLLGIYVPAGITVDVDGAGSQKLPIITCDGNGCATEVPIPADFLTAMAKGGKLNVIFQNLNKQPVTLTMSLAGFAAALKRIQ